MKKTKRFYSIITWAAAPVFILVLVPVTGLFLSSAPAAQVQDNTVMVCTFLGRGPDVIHEITLPYETGSKASTPIQIRIKIPGGELIKKVVYDRKNFQVDHNNHEVIVRLKTPTETPPYDNLAIITDKDYIYIFELKTRKPEAGEMRQYTENIVIQR